MNTTQLQPSLEHIRAVAREGLVGMRRNPHIYIDTTAGNCFSYTLAASESLEASGIEHRIAYVNDHATIVLPNNWMLDMYSPSAQQSLDGKLFLYPQESPERQIGRLARMKVLADVQSRKFGDPLEDFTWLRSPRDPFRPNASNNTAKTLSEPTLVVTLYKPALGRKAIRAYGILADNNQRDDIAAATAIISVGAAFPEVDMRTPVPRAVTRLVKRLAGNQQFDLAAQTTEAFFAGLNAEHDSRVREYKADCLRHIGRYSGQLELLQTAKELYKQARKQPHAWQKSIQSKLDRCETLITDTIGTTMKNRDPRYQPNYCTYETIRAEYDFTEAEAEEFRSLSRTLAADNPLSDYFGNIEVQADVYVTEILYARALEEDAQRIPQMGQSVIQLAQAA